MSRVPDCAAAAGGGSVHTTNHHNEGAAMRRISDFYDARRIVCDWVAPYLEYPSDEAIERAARALVAHVGGYDVDADAATWAAFDLDAALGDYGDDA